MDYGAADLFKPCEIEGRICFSYATATIMILDASGEHINMDQSDWIIGTD